MDFGDILKLWDTHSRLDTKGQKQASTKKINEAKAKTKTHGTTSKAGNSVAEAQSAWLDRYGTPEPSSYSKDSKPVRRMSKRDIDAMPIDARLDLHGLTSREAESALEAFFTAAERSGCRKVLVVHGRGLHSESEPVLASLVRRWLERRPSAGRSAYADASKGGNGATWVLLKRLS